MQTALDEYVFNRIKLKELVKGKAGERSARYIEGVGYTPVKDDTHYFAKLIIHKYGDYKGENETGR